MATNLRSVLAQYLTPKLTYGIFTGRAIDDTTLPYITVSFGDTPMEYQNNNDTDKEPSIKRYVVSLNCVSSDVVELGQPDAYDVRDEVVALLNNKQDLTVGLVKSILLASPNGTYTKTSTLECQAIFNVTIDTSLGD